MREVVHEYSVDLDWIENFANQLGGYVENNFMIIPDHVHSGSRYLCPINENISAFFIDVTYNEDVIYKVRNKVADFVGLYYSLTEGDAIMILDNIATPVGRWTYNVAVMDGSLDVDYMVKAGSKTFILCIFIKKDAVRGFLSKLEKQHAILDDIFNPEINTIIKYDNMTPYSWWLINELRKVPLGGPMFDLFCAGTVHNLIAEYLDHIKDNEVVLEKVAESDVLSIFSSQAYLIEQVKNNFPGIPYLAATACMSLTKYKNVFRKITGYTPNGYFLKNKLICVKEILEQGGFTISEVAHDFSFASAGHLSELFKNYFGVAPKEYLNRL